MVTRADDRGLFKRGRRWYLRLYISGHGKKVLALKPHGQSRATTNKDVARALARDLRKRLAEQAEQETPDKPVDLDELITQFGEVNALGGSEAQAKANKGAVRAFIAARGITTPAEITRGTIEDYLVQLKQAGKSVKTIWNHRGSVSRLCEFLIDRGHLDANPCKRMNMPKAERLLPRWLSEDEYKQALQLAEEHGIYAEVGTALYTGMRRAEIRRMEWADVDFDRAVVRVPRSKNKRPRAIPMSDKLRTLLVEQRKLTGDRAHVFPGSDSMGYSGRPASGMRRLSWWVDAIKPLQKAMPIFTANLTETATGRGWHLFRHTFASRLVQAGVPLAKVSAWLGHSDIRTTMIYAHLAPGHDEDIEHA